MTPSQPSRPVRNDPGRLRVLGVEDNADAALSTKLLIEMDGHEVHVARDGGAGLEAAAVGIDLRSRPSCSGCCGSSQTT
jgi:hypothetical protein